MEMQGEELINAPRDVVWEALNNADILKQAITGCEEIDKESDTSFTAKVKVKVGPVKATFKGQVTLSNMDAPNGYTITGEGKGGAAGFGKGGADITLEDSDGGTLLKYNVKASVGGKMAQIGSRLIDSTAKKLAGEFFRKFNELVSASAVGTDSEETEEILDAVLNANDPEAAQEPEPATPHLPEAAPQGGWMKPSTLIPIAIVIAAALYLVSQSGS
jgi:uncharacterized protein